MSTEHAVDASAVGAAAAAASAPAHLDPWREAVVGATAAVAIIELPSTRFIELSARAWELVGAGSTVGLDVMRDDQRTEAAAITGAAAAGVIDGTEVQSHQWHRPDGSTVTVMVRGRVIRLHGVSYGIWVARELPGGPVDPLFGPSDEVPGWNAREHPGDWEAVATIDDRWRLRRIAGGTQEVRAALGEGVSLVTATHPDDVARLLFAFAGATTHVNAAARIRLVGDGEPVAVDVEVAPLDDGSWRLELAPAVGPVPGDHRPLQRVRELERSLERIASELHLAGVTAGSPAAADVLLVPGVRALPERQREIVLRLAGGERVGTIADAMFLSPNTVRNHLSAVFRKFGVHSQQELLAALRDQEGDDPPIPG